MSVYFDDMTARVRDASQDTRNISDPDVRNAQFLERLASIEEEVAREVALCVGDREFPEDLREKMLRVLACSTVRTISGNLPPLDRAVEYALATRASTLIADLHSLFHELAGRDVKVRFGRLYDNPAGNNRRRDQHAAEMYRGAS